MQFSDEYKNEKIDPTIIKYLEDNIDVINNHIDFLYSTEEEMMEKDFSATGVEPNLKLSRYIIIKKIFSLLEYSIGDRFTMLSTDFIVKIKDYISENYTLIKEEFNWKSDSFLKNKTYQNTENLINKIFRFIGMKIYGIEGSRILRVRTYKVFISYMDETIDKIIPMIVTSHNDENNNI